MKNINQKLQQNAFDYYGLCVQIRNVNKEISDLKKKYEKPTEWGVDCVLGRVVHEMLEARKAESEYPGGDEIMNWFSTEDEAKVSYEDVERIFELYLLRRDLKGKKGKYKRALYLYGEYISRNTKIAVDHGSEEGDKTAEIIAFSDGTTTNVLDVKIRD